ncbi:uncharacterized protein MYCFIDRAFT_210209 [Pseudocercospora fijiensis CIRAD86]|uniref:SCP domain-containing protein n=1 Tax=Pseudocercospora fijiensis (strain CIRAD86) TaxID=383855 RepID=M3AL99_PSEFD|nr:uncharacterized protein MYCFIDRAFT_210209 [Pseudocercospora fijiensis CIRAD86]EME85351.1 hypothetical protein MYCFIDRAFT_210209 [Pseudocercospora fijiensis CIRAD86]
MRSSIALAAFAAGALAVPFNNEKRAVVQTAYDVVYVTDIVTVFAGYAPPAEPTPSSSSSSSSAPAPQHYGHHNNWHPSVAYTTVQQQPEPTPTPQPSTSTTPTQQAPPTYGAPSSQPSSPATNAGTGAAPTDYNGLVVYHHNLHRANHSCPDVQWSDDLYNTALLIAQSCVYAHNTQVNGGGYGQNIAAGVEPANVSAIITDLFYNGEEPYFASQYGKDNPDMTDFEKWGHFSQIVWKGTTHVACATHHCPNGLANTGSGVSPYFTVCNYKSPGNYAGEYATNVPKPKGMPSVQWNYGGSS